jgi:hypothetical protein
MQTQYADIKNMALDVFIQGDQNASVHLMITVQKNQAKIF